MIRTSLFVGFLLLLPSMLSAQGQEDLGVFGTPTTAGRWEGGFGAPGLSGSAYAWAVFDDGSGPAVYAAGSFAGADDLIVGGIARWDGQAWQKVGKGGFGSSQFGKEIRAMAVFDDGSGEALYIGGNFDEIDGRPAKGFARWDGKSWTVLPGTFQSNRIHTLLVGEDANGPALFAGGAFIYLGSLSVRNVARWNGAWQPMGAGVSEPVNALAFFDDGTGEALYAGLDDAPGAGSLRRWDGTSWSQIAGASQDTIGALKVFDTGAGARLAIGLENTTPAVYEWDGLTFSAMGDLSGRVEDLDVLPGAGAGNDLLIAAGSLNLTSGTPIGDVSAWDGSSWLPLGTPPGTSGDIDAMAVLNLGGSSEVYVDGGFDMAGSTPVRGTAKWDGTDWSRVGGDQFGLTGIVGGTTVITFAEYDDGSGPALYAGGHYSYSGVNLTQTVGRWNGQSLDQVGGGIPYLGGSTNVQDMVAFASGDGPVLVVGGKFIEAGGIPAKNIARWNGSNWAALGNGTNSEIHSVEVYDGLLYAGGRFTFAGPMAVSRIASWNGSSWSRLPGNLTTVVQVPAPFVKELVVFDDGSGDELLVGGHFDFADGVLVDNLAKWNGSSWSAVPFGGVTHTSLSASVDCILSVDLPSFGGKALIVEGTFDQAGTLPVDGLAVLTPSGWIAPGAFSRSTIQAMTVHDAGSGPRLFGYDYDLGLVRWNGSSWLALGSGPLTSGSYSGSVASMVGLDDANGPFLLIGGVFDTTGERVSFSIAKWRLGGQKGRPTLRVR